MASAVSIEPVVLKSSVFYSELSHSQTDCVAGKWNPIGLPSLSQEKFLQYLGDKITESSSGAQIFRVASCEPPRIFKLIQETSFDQGDEVRIAKIAAELKVAPAFHSASLVSFGQSRQFVVLEMDDAGLALGIWMEKFGAEEEAAKAKHPVVEEQEILSEEEKAYREMLARVQAQLMTKSRFIVSVKKEPPRVDMEVAVERLWPSQESFYFQLFSRIRALAEERIAYIDVHVGNIIPEMGAVTEMKLIDFGSAKIMPDVKSAADQVIRTSYGKILFNQYVELPNKSELSVELLEWFVS